MSKPPNEYGFKRVTPENWLTIDPAWGAVMMSSSRPDPGEAWVHDLVQVRLHERVPLNVRKLFEVARGTMAYSLMFYPLLTLGTEQLYRVIEAAVSAKCVEMAAPPLNNFKRKIDWLVSRNAIDPQEAQRWTYIVHLRNDASHPSDQNIYWPGMTLSVLDISAELINDLFAEAPQRDR